METHISKQTSVSQANRIQDFSSSNQLEKITDNRADTIQQKRLLDFMNSGKKVAQCVLLQLPHPDDPSSIWNTDTEHDPKAYILGWLETQFNRQNDKAINGLIQQLEDKTPSPGSFEAELLFRAQTAYQSIQQERIKENALCAKFNTDWQARGYGEDVKIRDTIIEKIIFGEGYANIEKAEALIRSQNLSYEISLQYQAGQLITIEVGKGQDSESNASVSGATLIKNGILTHNHPRSNPLSAGDIVEAIYKNLKAIRANVAEGVFVMEKSNDAEKWPMYSSNITKELELFIRKGGQDMLASAVDAKKLRPEAKKDAFLLSYYVNLFYMQQAGTVIYYTYPPTTLESVEKRFLRYTFSSEKKLDNFKKTQLTTLNTKPKERRPSFNQLPNINQTNPLLS